MSISTTIDHIIQRANKVKVCQEHFKPITTSLTRLQHAFNETDALTNGCGSHEDIEEILKAIDELIASCSENDTDLNGVTYKELQSLLVRLQWRLAQHEANMTDDYDVKIQRLSNAYNELNTLIGKTSDDTIKQKFEEIEQHTKENTTEQLRVLREKHTETIESYLRSCTDLHKSISLTDITADTVAKVAQTFYQISTEDQIQFELPLTCAFVRFKADTSTAFERNEARKLVNKPEDNLSEGPLRAEEASKSIWQRLVSAPDMISIAERNRYVPKDDVGEENIIRTKRWILILGDPGSGKTSFSRWLVHHLAQTLLLNDQHSTDYGPLRIPILIRIGEFAEMLKEQPSLTLFDYIGKHKWMGKAIVDDPSISLDDLTCALQDYIKQGQAFIILDGLDEIPVSDQRSKINNIVENFVDTYVQIPTGAFDNAHLSKLLDNPSQSGGNQLIITSRFVGYHAAPLAGRFSHYTIRPMDMERMKNFVNHWFFHVHQQILDAFRFPLINQGENHGEALKKELEKPENVSLLDVASNPSLMSFICNISFNQLDGSPLPTQRICLYEQIVNSMLNLWSDKQSIIPKPKLVRILSDIAFSIHKYSASSFIDKEEIQDVCFQSIKSFKSKILLTSEDIQDIENQASEFARIIREDVGVLAIRGKSLYGFLHLTFQEYFTCLKLIEVDKSTQKDRENEIQSIVRSMRHYSNDPRFRIPIALALGKISSSWSQKDIDDFFHAFIQEQDESDSLLPFGAYMLVISGNDLVNYPSDDVFFNALNRLIIAADQHKWSDVCPFLFEQITNGLRKLQYDIVPKWINNFLTQSSSHDIQTISTFCRLIEGKPHEFENIKWLNQASCSILQSFSTFDNENNGFAIDRLLVKVAFSSHQVLLVNPTSFKGFLLGEEIQPNSIPVVLFPLILTLYGGLKRDGQTVVFDPSYIHRESIAVTPILIRFLSIKDRTKQDQGLKKLKQECIKSFLARIENNDESCETIDLCIATICLYDIEYVQDNPTIISSSLLRMSMNRLKYISMILRQFYFTGDENDRSIENETTKFISVAIEKFQYGESARVQFLDLLNSLRSGVIRLRSSTTSTLLEGKLDPQKRLTLHLPNSLRKEDKFLHGLLSTDTRFPSDRSSCSLLHHFTKLFWILEHNDEHNTQYRMAVALDAVPEYLVFRNDQDLLCSLIFIPPHLQNLYLRLLKQKYVIITSNDITGNDRHRLYFGHILTECLILLSNASCKRLIILAALVTLLPYLRIHQLENFGSSLLWALGTKYSDHLGTIEIKRQRPMNYETGRYMDIDEDIFNGGDMTGEQRRTLIRDNIEQEHERLQKVLTESDGRDMKLYSACVSLAHVCRWSEDERRLHLLNKSVQGAMSVSNKLARLDALCVIALYSPSDYAQIQVSTGRSVQQEIEHQFNDIYPTLPLLLHATIFIRCLSLLKNQQTIDQCLQSLFEKFADNDQRDQQAVSEALSPYLQSNSAFVSVTKYASHSLSDNSRTTHNKSSVLKKYFNIDTNQNLSFSVLISNLYVVELAKDFHEFIKTDVRQFTNDESIVTMLFEFENSILTEAQALSITNILSLTPSTNRSVQSEKLCALLSNALHRASLVEFKARYLLESWMKWKDSNELSSFAYHAALLLTNSGLWSVEAAAIVCDLLCNENDRFRRQAEIIFRSSNDNDVRTSSKMGINVLLVLAKKKAHYQFTLAFGKLTITRIFGSIYVDIQSHLETFLWLERYRIHALANKNYSLNKPRSCAYSYIASYFDTDTETGACSSVDLFKISGDLIIYMCDMIACNFFSFLEIDGDTTSNAVLESHNQFVVSVVLSFCNLHHTDYTRQLAVEALMNLFEMSNNDDIRRAVAHALGYVCSEKTYKGLFEKIQLVSNNGNSETSIYSNNILATLISSYSYCMCMDKIAFDQDDMDLFSNLLKHSSDVVLKAVHTGYGRILNDKSFLLEMLGSDYIQCYHALIGSTAHIFICDVQQNSENSVAEFIEENPVLLSIFIIELYNSIRHFTGSVIPIGGTDFNLAYGYPQYVKIASLVAVRMTAAFCTFIKDWPDGNKLKRALFYTSKQHNFPQRAACLTILSLFGELTVELCEIFIEALHDDPYIQNTCYKCLTRINSIKDEKVVLNLLFSYLKSKSMNVRYVAAKILLHLSKSSLIPFNQVEMILNKVILDPDSNEDLRLIEEQDDIFPQCVYYYAGPLKDAIYSLLVQHLIGDTSGIVRRNELNDIDLNFIESEKVSRLASCLYEAKAEADVKIDEPPTPNHRVDSDGDSVSLDSILNGNESD